MSTIKVDTIQTSSGVTQKTIQASVYYDQLSTQDNFADLGVSSLTDESTGITTVSFDTSFSNTNYLLLSGNANGEGSTTNTDANNISRANTIATGSMKVQSKVRGFTYFDYAYCYVAFAVQ